MGEDMQHIIIESGHPYFLAAGIPDIRPSDLSREQEKELRKAIQSCLEMITRMREALDNAIELDDDDIGLAPESIEFCAGIKPLTEMKGH